jgi:selenide,water dikinase
VPQAKLREYVAALAVHARPNECPGMDCAIVATRHAGLFSVSTTDFFYPLVECPYLQGRIGACNVLSDLYAVGVGEVDTVLMLLAVSMDMEPRAADTVTSEMMRGFSDCVAEAGASVTGGQTVRNPWPMIGGCASALAREAELVRPEGARVGNVLVLTKPLGTQVAVNVWQRRPPHAHWEARLAPAGLTLAAAAELYDAACASMASLSARAGALLAAHGATAATDVTGFGILGHAANLAEHTSAPCVLRLHTLPCLPHAAALDAALGAAGWGLRRGFSAETSGGLLVALPSAAAAEAFCAALGGRAWVVGDVVARPEGAERNSAEIAEDAQMLSV